MNPTPTPTLIKALRTLARDIQSGDGVANAAIAEAAERMETLVRELAEAKEEIAKEYDVVKDQQARLKACAVQRDALRAECCRAATALSPTDACDLPTAVKRAQSREAELRAEVEQIRNTLQDGLDRDKDDTTTPHLAVVAVNALAHLRARVTELESQGAAQAFVDTSVRASEAEQRVKELEADKARLDWVEQYRGDMQRKDGSFVFPDHPNPVRAAIDAAREKGQP